VGSKFQQCFLMHIPKVHVRKQSGTQLFLPYWSIAEHSHLHLIFNICIHSHINHLLQLSFHIYILDTYAYLKISIIGVSTSFKVHNWNSNSLANNNDATIWSSKCSRNWCYLWNKWKQGKFSHCNLRHRT